MLHKAIDFISGLVPPKKTIACLPLIESLFHNFTDDQRFKQSPFCIVGLYLVLGSNIQEIGSEPRVVKIELRHLDQSFVEIRMVRPEQKNNKTGFQNRNPGFGCGMGKTTLIGQCGHIQELADPAGAQLLKNRTFLKNRVRAVYPSSQNMIRITRHCPVSDI